MGDNKDDVLAGCLFTCAVCLFACRVDYHAYEVMCASVR